MDKNIPSINLEQMVNVIRLSKVVKNPLDIEHKTNISILYIHYVLQNQNDILDRWERRKGINALLLEWVARCKNNNIKLSSSAIFKESKVLSTLFREPSYHIESKIWSEIKLTLSGKLNDKESSENMNLDAYSIFLTEGKRLLEPKTYQKFLATVKERRFAHKNNGESKTAENQETPNSNEFNEDVILIETPIKCIDITNEDDEVYNNIEIINELLSPTNSGHQVETSASLKDFPALKTITLEREQENTKENIIKQEPQEYIGDETNIRPVQIENEIPDSLLEERQNENFEEFLDISDDAPEIKQEFEFIEDDKTDCFEIYEFVDNEDENDESVNKENLNDLQETEIERNSTEFNNYSSQQIELQQNIDKLLDSPVKQISEVESNIITNAPAVGEDDDSKEIELLVIDESDEDIKNELMNIINKHKNTKPEIGEHKNSFENNQGIKQEALDEVAAEEQEDDDFITVLEIISDDETVENEAQVEESDFVKAKVIEKSKSQSPHEHSFSTIVNDNIPTTSRTAYLPTSTPPNKKARISFNPSEDLITSSIKSNQEAFKCVHYVKEYFQTQKDVKAVKLLHKLQMSFFDNNYL